MREIPLTQGKVALVDDADYEWLSQWNWFAWRSRKGREFWYCRRSASGGVKLYMHREIIGVPGGPRIDHRDRNGLNNQRSNLRVCTQALNMANRGLDSNNTSGAKGVYWDKERDKWVAQLHVNGRHIFIGRFAAREEAAEAYDLRAIAIWGEFARTNQSMGLVT